MNKAILLLAAAFGLGVMAQAQNATVPTPSHITATATEKAKNAAAPATKAYKKQTKKYHKKAGAAAPEGSSTGAQ
jgi:hypothetical protein